MSLYTNRQLFSDHWLRERLPACAEYAPTPLALARFALWTWTRYLPPREATPSTDANLEAATDDVATGLRALGYATEHWQAMRANLWSEGPLRWQLATPHTMDETRVAGGARSESSVLVVATPQGVAFDDRHGDAPAPSAQLLRLLAGSEAGWGILSDGVRWRLYQHAGAALEAHYEVDLAELAATRDVDALKYVWLFFAADAHLPGDDDRPFLDTALAESRAYAAGIEDDLRSRAYDAISAGCQALADALAAERGIPVALLSREDLSAIYADALALLYRLLFILFAESRELLPIEDPRYHGEWSLRALIERLPGASGTRSEQTQDTPRAIWTRLLRLFRALDDDDRPSYLPAFKGRLFERDAHPLLRDLTPADEPLARMLALLGRTRDGRLIDYADLAVRQLGSIYEGLLEHQAIAVAVEEMALVKGPKDNVPRIAPLSQASGRRVIERYAPGTVYLSNDRGERHTAGAYYTPDPVVRYLVDETLGPLVAGKRAEEILRLKALDPAMGSGHFLVAAVDFLARAALAAEAEDLRGAGSPARPRTDDPGAQDTTTADRAALDGGVLALKRRIAEQCVYGVDLNESAVELAKLSLWLATAARGLPLTFLDAHLRAGNSLVGLAPGELEAATEPPATPTRRRKAAKGADPAPSASATGDSGNARPAQPELWDETSFTQDMFRLVGGRQVIDLMDSHTAEDVRAKTRVLETLDPLAAPYRRLADLAVSRRFGNQMPPEVYLAAARTLLDRVEHGMRLPEVTLAPSLAEARRIAERQRAFHWEVEFPEVFRDRLGRSRGTSAGFDALLGNPPYVSVNTLRAADPEAWAYFPQVYLTTAQGKYDLYAAFVERGLALLNAHGRLAYILPNKWLTTDAGVGLRGLLAARRATRAVVDFGAYPVFPSVSNYTCLLFAGRASVERVAVAQRTTPEGEMALPPRAESGLWALGEVAAASLASSAWDLTVGGAQNILDRIRHWPTLGEQVTIFVGTCTNANPVFIIHEREREDNVAICWSPALGRDARIEAALLRPVLQGRDIAPYICDDGGNRLLFPYRVRAGGADLLPQEELQQQYPLAWAYLNHPAIKASLEARENGHFRGKANWYGFGRPQSMHLLGETKLVLPDVAARGRVAFDAAGSAIVDTAYGIVSREGSPYARFFLLAALNSPVLTFFLRHRGADLRGGYFRMKTRYLEPFPLPPLAWDLPEGERRAQTAWALARVQSGMTEGEPPERLAEALAHLAPEALHDVVAALAERAGELATRERAAWRDLVARVAALRPAQMREEAVASLLTAPRPGAPFPPQETADALVAALGGSGPALTAPELAALREAFRTARLAAGEANRARSETTRLSDLLLYRLYALTPADVAVVEGDAGVGHAMDNPQEFASAESAIEREATSKPPRKAKASKRPPTRGAEKDRATLELEDMMRTVSKGGQPQNILTCLRQALERPYCAQGDMNRAMGYVEGSATGGHYVALAWLAGLLDETPVKCWLRPTKAGRAVVAAGDESDALWDALLALPGLRRFLEFELIGIEASARGQSTAQGKEIRDVWEADFPGFAERVGYLYETLRLSGLSSPQTHRELGSLAPLEPLAESAARELASTHGLAGGLSRLTKAQRIARALSSAAERPVRLDAAWLTPTQLQGIILLAAAREQGLGCVVARGAPGELARGLDTLCRGGVDVRLQQRAGGDWVGALARPVAIHLRDTSRVDAMVSRARGTPLEASAELISEALQRQKVAGADGLARGALDLEALGQACARELRDSLGEPAAHPAAVETTGAPSDVTVGPPLPLASDLPRLGLEYRFLDEAVRVRAGRARPGVAALLTDWLDGQQGGADMLLALNPHLALLYLVAADTGAQAELLGRGPTGWTLAGEPLVAALDARLRGLGYEVWDERYAGDGEALRLLGESLVEQGLRSDVLRSGGSALLDAPDSRWYFRATDLLAVAPAGRGMR